MPSPRAVLRSFFDAAVEAAEPAHCLLSHLPVLRRYGIDARPAVVRVVESGEGETVKPGDPRPRRHRSARIVATPGPASSTDDARHGSRVADTA
jgi:glycerate-2-kinase